MDFSPPAWSDPFFLRAVFYLALVTALTIAALGVPSLLRRRAADAWPLAFVFLTLLGTLVVLGTRYTDVAGVDGLPKRLRILPSEKEGAAPRTFEEFLGLPSVMPKAQQVLDVLPGFLQSVERTLRRLDPLLERTDRVLSETEPLLADLRKLGPVLDKAGPALDEATPLLRATNLALADVRPTLTDLRAATLELQSTLGERNLGSTVKQLLSTLDRLETTLIQADQLMMDLAFLDENWVRHFLQVEGVQAYAKFGEPTIPPQSKPSEPPPLSGK